MLREHEHSARLFTGATYFLFSSLLSVIIFSKLIAITSLAILIVADTAASLVGRRYGKTFFLSKTLEGSIAFIISGWLTIFTLGFLFQTTFKYYMIGLIAVLFGAIVEIFSAKLRIDDNFTIPLTVGFTFTFMEYLLR
jgi:dolichol kinase